MSNTAQYCFQDKPTFWEVLPRADPIRTLADLDGPSTWGLFFPPRKEDRRWQINGTNLIRTDEIEMVLWIPFA